MSETGICGREDQVCYGLTLGEADSQLGGPFFFQAMANTTSCFLQESSWTLWGDLGNPAETGWQRGLGFLCDKTWPCLLLESLSIFLRMKGAHHRNLTTFEHVASSKVNPWGSCNFFQSTLICQAHASLPLIPSHAYFSLVQRHIFLMHSTKSKILVMTQLP